MLGVYKAIRVSFEKLFALNHRTYRHAAPKMAKTIKKLCEYMAKEKAHVVDLTRTSKYNVPDVMEVGFVKLIEQSVSMVTEDEGGLEDGIEDEINGDDGDLDV